MKKRLAKALAIGLTAAMTIGIAGCGKSSSSSDSASGSSEYSDYGGKNKVFRIGIECAYAPYNWTQESEDVANGDKAVKIQNSDGYAYGYDVVMAQKIADQLGWKLEVYKSDWSAIFMGLDAGSYDCIMSGICYTEERDKTLDFTSAYYCRKIMAVVRSDSEYANFTSLSQFDGLKPKVTTQMGTNYVKYAEQVPSCERVTDYETSGEAFQAVQNKTADVVVLDETTCQSALMTMDGLTMLEIPTEEWKDPEGETNDCSICFRDKDPERDEVQSAMDAIGWTKDNRDQMDSLMDEMLKVQPSQG